MCKRILKTENSPRPSKYAHIFTKNHIKFKLKLIFHFLHEGEISEIEFHIRTIEKMKHVYKEVSLNTYFSTTMTFYEIPFKLVKN